MPAHCCRLLRVGDGYSSAKTHTAPPSGTSGYSPGKSRFRVACIPRESPPHPEWTAMYCFPSTRNEVGGAKISDVVGNSHSSLPVVESNELLFRSFVTPV